MDFDDKCVASIRAKIRVRRDEEVTLMNRDRGVNLVALDRVTRAKPAADTPDMSAIRSLCKFMLVAKFTA